MAAIGGFPCGDDNSDAPISLRWDGHDGFVLSGMRGGYLVEHRFIGWTVLGARKTFRAYLRGKISTPTGAA